MYVLISRTYNGVYVHKGSRETGRQAYKKTIAKERFITPMQATNSYYRSCIEIMQDRGRLLTKTSDLEVRISRNTKPVNQSQ